MTRRLVIGRPGLVLPVRIDPTGENGPTKGQARGPGWRASSRGLHVPASALEDSPEQRIVEAAAVLPAIGGVTGWAGLRWAGGAWFEGTKRGGTEHRPVPLAVCHHDIRPQPGIEISQEHLDLRDLTELDGLPMTSLVRSLCFEMRYARSERDAAVAFCMAAYSDLVSQSEVWKFLDRHRGWRGTPLVRSAMEVVDENCWSPPEVDMLRAWMRDADLERPLCNHPVFDRQGNHIGTPDLLDPVAGVVGEYEGEVHLDGGQRRVDREKEATYRRAGLEVFTLLRGDFGSSGRAVALMREARKRARFAAESTRAWTVELPSWWIPTFTVEQRRNLTSSDRERVLRYRRTTPSRP